MKELFDISIQSWNLFPTMLLLFAALYWVTFLIGLLDLSFLDFDLDMDKDLSLDKSFDLDLDAEADVDVDADSGGTSFGMQVLHFVNLDAVPFMVWFSFTALFFWAGNLLAQVNVDTAPWFLRIAMMFGTFIGAALLTKMLTQPLRGFFRSFNEEDKPIDFRGRICRLELGVSDQHMGQADLTVDGRHILLTVRSENGQTIERGTQCVIVDYDAEREIYTVAPFAG